MKKTLILAALIFTAGFLKAAPGKGGYMGHRFIIGVEGAYAPFYTSVSDFFTKYNFQYGGNIGVITGRRTQLNLNYNMWSLGNNQVYNKGIESVYHKSDRIKGMEFGATLRTFKKKRGGIAPIGKFYDIGLTYTHNEYIIGKGNPGYNTLMLTDDFLNQIIFHVAAGTQMVFWDHIVANTGIRLAAPVLSLDSSRESKFLMQRTFEKDIFQVFFGVGVLL
ncbi:MAG: hypothetical protein ABIQ40_09255 [Bacteroidia bacterium]